MPLDADDMVKIQTMVSNAIPRNEYESRHIELAQRVTRIEDGLSQLYRKHQDDIETVKNTVLASQDVLRTKVDESNKQIDAVLEMLHSTREEQLTYQTEQKTYALRYIITTVVSFVITMVTVLGTRFIH